MILLLKKVIISNIMHFLKGAGVTGDDAMHCVPFLFLHNCDIRFRENTLKYNIYNEICKSFPCFVHVFVYSE